MKIPYTIYRLSFSLTMTILSNVLAFGIMPLNIWLYSRSWTSETLQVPFKNIFISLVMTVLPAAIGVCVRWKWEKAALIMTKVGGYLLQSYVYFFSIYFVNRTHIQFLFKYNVHVNKFGYKNDRNGVSILLFFNNSR